MQYSVDDFVGPITLKQRDELDRVLNPGERILWATRPRASVLHPWQEYRSSFYLFIIPFLVFGVYGGARVMLHFLPLVLDGAGGVQRVLLRLFALLLGATAFWLSGRQLVQMLCTFFGIRFYRRHTLYILTDQRAISLEPRPWSWVLRSWALEEGMIRERRQTVAGGELIFCLEGSMLPGPRMRRGWTALESVEEAEQAVERAVAEAGKSGEE